MKIQKEKNKKISTFLIYSTIPLSGFAIDLYLPSFPAMVTDLDSTVTNLQLSLTIFLLAYGISQLCVGVFIDSFGRYRACLGSLLIFAISSFIITITSDIYLVIFLRGLQGLLMAIMMISQRSFLVDLHKNEPEKLRNYTSLLSIIWSTAPVIAPFLGGYIQYYSNWKMNFYFLGVYAIVMLVLHLIFSGEALKEFKPFHLKTIRLNYYEMLFTKDFIYGVLLLGAGYSMIIIFGMTIPFIVENKYNLSSKVVGNLNLISGSALFIGGLASRYLINRSVIYKKLLFSISCQIILSLIMFLYGTYNESIISIMFFVVLFHFILGFIYNMYFTYCLTRFTKYAGLSGGFTSGGAYIVTSFMAFLISYFIPIENQQQFAISYFLIALTMLIFLILAYPRLRALHQKKTT